MSDQGSSVPDDSEKESSTELPAVDFSTFMLSLGHSVLVHLGQAPSIDGQQTEPHLDLARQTIDLLALLQEKTKGNLSGEEERIVEQLLYDLRLRYTEVASKA
ncbi:MAG: DUF1844 domain-containing protein [Polyangiaceae bacterium]|nr:DUF1844 domain-containing protein [Polyangiaceae bacterium]